MRILGRLTLPCGGFYNQSNENIRFFTDDNTVWRISDVHGGAAARCISDACSAGLDFLAPPLELCTDNAAMIAWAGLERLRLGLVDGLDTPPRPRWPLDAGARPRPGAGVKA